MPAHTRFSLKALMALVTFFCLWLGGFVALTRRMVSTHSTKVPEAESLLWMILFVVHCGLCTAVCRVVTNWLVPLLGGTGVGKSMLKHCRIRACLSLLVPAVF